MSAGRAQGPMGIFGGTFDPIHYGHLRTAFELREALKLEEVRFLPTGNPPHREQTQASADERLAIRPARPHGFDVTRQSQQSVAQRAVALASGDGSRDRPRDLARETVRDERGVHALQQLGVGNACRHLKASPCQGARARPSAPHRHAARG